MPINEEYLAAFFGKNADYYLYYWRQLQAGRRVSFNAAAFFVGLFWFIYRRMYGVALLLVGLLIVEAQLEQWLLPRFIPGYNAANPGSVVVVNLVAASLYAAFGNWIYLSHARRKITRVLRRETSEEAILQQLRRRGGTSWTFFLLALGLVAAIVLLAQLYAPQP
ncbi:DUF2628 domain-containing protein [Hymenobacter gummosus]|nr:DUF2628 domain-containing protein [Hymenobacter gummosus]